MTARPSEPSVELIEAKSAQLGDITINRALPRRPRRTVSSWCFLDHMGPLSVPDDRAVDVPPHPHIGLQTVTWLFDGELVHHDSLGTVQSIKPGQLNLMTAGGGVAHSEEGAGRGALRLHGVQLWVAQPEATRHGDRAFEHHGELPGFELANGSGTVLVGELAGVTSPARRDTDHLGAVLELRAGTDAIELQEPHEHALFVVEGEVAVDGRAVPANTLAYLAPGRSQVEVTTSAPARVVLLGGEPFPDELVMWWNYVGRTRDEVAAAHEAWTAGDEARFGLVPSQLARTVVPPPPWAPA